MHIWKNRDNAVLESSASANYKMLLQLAKDPKDDRSYFSIDTGMNGNPLQGSYFIFNEDHLKGELMEMKWTPEKLEGTRLNKLHISPKKGSAEKQQKVEQGENSEL